MRKYTDDDDQDYCQQCAGTGEGMTPDTTCRLCNGSGMKPIELDEEDFDAE
jgi:DnaJ-class molecular chaperone